MSTDEDQREYRAMTQLDDALWTLLESGWERGDLIGRCEDTIGDWIADNAEEES